LTKIYNESIILKLLIALLKSGFPGSFRQRRTGSRYLPAGRQGAAGCIPCLNFLRK